MRTTLDKIEKGKRFIIKRVDEKSPIKKRLWDLGITEGTPIERLFESPLGDPAAYRICGTVIALRIADAKRIEVAQSE